MDFDILKCSNQVILNLIEKKNPYEKIAMILKVIPIESFDEAFRFFSNSEQKKILEAMEIKIKVNSIDTMMVVREFIKSNELSRFLKTTTLGVEETLQAFQEYASKRPRQISIMLSKTWLEKNDTEEG